MTSEQNSCFLKAPCTKFAYTAGTFWGKKIKKREKGSKKPTTIFHSESNLMENSIAITQNCVVTQRQQTLNMTVNAKCTFTLVLRASTSLRNECDNVRVVANRKV